MAQRWSGLLSRSRAVVACSAELSFGVSQVAVLENYVKIRIRKLTYGAKQSKKHNPRGAGTGRHHAACTRELKSRD